MLERLPFPSGLEAYSRQAEVLWAAWRAGDAAAIDLVRHQHPRFVNPRYPWLPRDMTEAELRESAFDLADAQLALAHWYDFQDWRRLAEFAGAAGREGSAVWRFESAVEAVIGGDTVRLGALLRADPGLIRERSTRVTRFDPPRHRATLLHYLAANGVEGYRQKSPPNAEAVARLLLDAGAEPDAQADLYGRPCTTMNMLVSSAPPAQAGVQVPLIDALVDYGAAVNRQDPCDGDAPLLTALAFGYRPAAEALVRRGAKVDRLAAAAGLGLAAEASRYLPAADAAERHRALALAAQHGHAEIVRMLLDAGEDPNRYNPKGHHAHSTPLHQAALAGHEEVVRLLVERGARLDLRDAIFQGTPLGWALHEGRTAVAGYLRDQERRRL